MIITRHFWFKCVITFILIALLFLDINSLHNFAFSIFKNNFTGITTVSSKIIEIIFVSYMLATVSLSVAIVGLAAKWPVFSMHEQNNKEETPE